MAHQLLSVFSISRHLPVLVLCHPWRDLSPTTSLHSLLSQEEEGWACYLNRGRRILSYKYLHNLFYSYCLCLLHSSYYTNLMTLLYFYAVLPEEGKEEKKTNICVLYSLM